MNRYAETLKTVSGAMRAVGKMPNTQSRMLEAANEIERIERKNQALQARMRELEKDRARLEWMMDSCIVASIYETRDAIDAAMEATCP